MYKLDLNSNIFYETSIHDSCTLWWTILHFCFQDEKGSWVSDTGIDKGQHVFPMVIKAYHYKGQLYSNGQFML